MISVMISNKIRYHIISILIFVEQIYQLSYQLLNHKLHISIPQQERSVYQEEHKIKVSVCWNYQAGNCEFQDDSCWFAHKQTNDFTSEQFKCNTCQFTFKNRLEYLGHRKLNHMEMVPICKNIIKGKCEYSEDKCWFNHQRISNQNKNETETIENQLMSTE